MVRRCIVCGQKLDNHPRRLYCFKRRCQRIRFLRNMRKYLNKLRVKLDRKRIRDNA